MRYGIEIEAENMPTPFSIENGRYTEDGSLRNNGVEYVSNILADVNEAKKWNKDVVSKLVESNASFSVRCGVHIHMDFTDTSLIEKRRFFYKYLLVERMLSSIISTRSKSNFCLPILNYDGDIGFFKGLFKSSKNSIRVCSMLSKYSALNLKPLVRYGTMEFRMLPSISDTNLFDTVIDILDFIRNHGAKEVICKYNLPDDIVLEARSFYLLVTSERDTSSMDHFDKVFNIVKEKISFGITEDDLIKYLRG